MRPEKIQRLKQTLIDMRRRIAGEVEYVAEAIQEDMNPAGNLSGVPVHLADVANETLVADVHVLETEQGLLGEVDAALARIDNGTFGTCENCESSISKERLEAVPFAALCIECASATEDRPMARAWGA